MATAAERILTINERILTITWTFYYNAARNQDGVGKVTFVQVQALWQPQAIVGLC